MELDVLFPFVFRLFLTVTLHFNFTFPILAVILAVPAFLATSQQSCSELLSKYTTFLLLVLHFTDFGFVLFLIFRSLSSPTFIEILVLLNFNFFFFFAARSLHGSMEKINEINNSTATVFLLFKILILFSISSHFFDCCNALQFYHRDYSLSSDSTNAIEESPCFALFTTASERRLKLAPELEAPVRASISGTSF